MYIARHFQRGMNGNVLTAQVINNMKQVSSESVIDNGHLTLFTTPFSALEHDLSISRLPTLPYDKV